MSRKESPQTPPEAPEAAPPSNGSAADVSPGSVTGEEVGPDRVTAQAVAGEAPGETEVQAAAAVDAGEAASETDTVDPIEEPVDELAAAKAEATVNYDKYLRAAAELDNVMRRQKRELGERVRYGAEALARDLLAVVDNLERALQHAGDGSAGLVEGVELVLKGLLDALVRHGVERVEADGAAFDPTVHEAIGAVETAEAEPGTVLQVHQTGYRLHDRLLRPAMVVVAKSVTEKPAG